MASSKVLEFLIELGVRLEARSTTICYASVLLNKSFENMPRELCPYTVACACMSLAAKTCDDNRVRLRAIVAVAYRILHMKKPPLPLGDLETSLRKSLMEMEPVVLRFLAFDLTVILPHNHAYLISAALRDFFKNQFASNDKFPTILGTLLQDVAVYPEFLISHTPLTSSIVVISLALQIAKIPIPDKKWIGVYSDSLSLARLDRLKRKFLKNVYEQK